MALHVDKPRADPWWQIIHESSDEVEKPVDNAVKRTISKFQSWSLGEMERRLKKNQQSAAVDAVDWKGFQESLEQELHQRIQRSMKKTARESANKLGLDFDPSDKKLLRAAKLRARKSARLITNESRQALKETIKEYSKQGLTPRQIRSRVRPMLGLTRRQAYSLRHQEKLMRAKGASHAQIQKKLKGLSKRYAKQRSSYIARFEGLGASQQGADTVISTAMAEGDIEHVEKKWIRAARDSCQICRRLNGQRVEFNARFIDPKTKKRYDNPPDPHGNCRCGLHYYFKKVPQGQHVAASEFFHAQHDQKSHGRRKKGGRPKGLPPGAVPLDTMAPNRLGRKAGPDEIPHLDGLAPHQVAMIGEFETQVFGDDIENVMSVSGPEPDMPEGGFIIGRNSGDSHSVRMSKHEMLITQLDGNAVVSHNHPGEGISFSAQDIRIAKELDVAEIRVTAHIKNGGPYDGAVTYRLKRPTHGWYGVKEPPKTFADDAIDEFMPFMHEVQKSGGFPKIADGEHVSWHRAVKKYAKKSRLKYSRTIVKDDGSIYVDEVGG